MNLQIQHLKHCMKYIYVVCSQSTLFAGASLYENFPNSTDNTLLLLVQLPTGQPGSSRLCTYQISDINSTMEAGQTDCANGNQRPVVWDDDFPSSLFNVICSLDVNCCLRIYMHCIIYFVIRYVL